MADTGCSFVHNGCLEPFDSLWLFGVLIMVLSYRFGRVFLFRSEIGHTTTSLAFRLSPSYTRGLLSPSFSAMLYSSTHDLLQGASVDLRLWNWYSSLSHSFLASKSDRPEQPFLV